MKIYLSGKISGLTIYKAKSNFWKATQETRKIFICEKGITIINPLNIRPLFGIKTWTSYMIADIWKLLWCQAIAMLPNWEDSKGAKIEYKIAKITRKQIIYLEKPCQKRRP